MRNGLHALALAMVLGSGPAAHATLIAYDGFEGYGAGSDLNGGNLGTGWAGAWAAPDGHTTVQTKTLVDPNNIVDGGQQAARFQPTANLGDIGSFTQRAIPATTDTLYMGLLIRKEVFDAADFLNFQVSNGATGNTTAMLGVGIRNAGGNPFFARVGSSSSGNTVNAGTNAEANTDYLIVAKFSKFGGSSTYNRTELFIDPADSTERGTADATANFSGTGVDTLSLFSVRHFQPEAGDTVFIDELRFATTFPEALGIPEPASILLLGIGALMLTRLSR